jgi:hypothetical protein
MGLFGIVFGLVKRILGRGRRIGERRNRNPHTSVYEGGRNGLQTDRLGVAPFTRLTACKVCFRMYVYDDNDDNDDDEEKKKIEEEKKQIPSNNDHQ